MELQITGRNMQVTDRLDDYVRRKSEKLTRLLPQITYARMDLTVENTRSAAHSQVAQMTIRSERGTILRAEERTADMFTSIDTVMDKMSRQIVRYKGKKQRARRAPAPPESEIIEPVDEMAQIVRSKRFTVHPMTEEEAVEQMELLGHDFFLFYHPDEDSICLLYRRKDGNYGILVPVVD